MAHTARILLALAFASSLHAQNDKVRPGPWQTAAKVPAGWVVYNTKNYHVQSQSGMEKAKRLGDHMEIMNVTYRKMFKPDKGGEKQQTIKLFKDDKSFKAYGAPAGAAAYYSAGEREMVCYDTGKWSDEPKPANPTTGPDTALDRLSRRMSKFDDSLKMDLLGCAAHEGWHQYYHWLVVSRVALPSWINEGMGDYFYTAAPNGTGKVKKAELGRMFDGRLWVIKTAKRQDRMVPLAEFLQMLQQDYYSNPNVCYAQGWAFCQFLLHGAEGKYAKIIPNYVRMLCNDTDWKSVQEKAFKGFDTAVMQTEFTAYIDTLNSTAANPFEGEDEPAEGAEPGAEPPAPPPPPPAGGGGTGGGTPGGG